MYFAVICFFVFLQPVFPSDHQCAATVAGTDECSGDVTHVGAPDRHHLLVVVILSLGAAAARGVRVLIARARWSPPHGASPYCVAAPAYAGAARGGAPPAYALTPRGAFLPRAAPPLGLAGSPAPLPPCPGLDAQPAEAVPVLGGSDAAPVDGARHRQFHAGQSPGLTYLSGLVSLGQRPVDLRHRGPMSLVGAERGGHCPPCGLQSPHFDAAQARLPHFPGPTTLLESFSATSDDLTHIRRSKTAILVTARLVQTSDDRSLCRGTETHNDGTLLRRLMFQRPPKRGWRRCSGLITFSWCRRKPKKSEQILRC